MNFLRHILICSWRGHDDGRGFGLLACARCGRVAAALAHPSTDPDG